MMQGDEYAIPVEILTESGPAAGDSFVDVEIIIGGIRKSLKAGEITYSAEQGAFMFPVSQRETLMRWKGKQPAQVRVKLSNGNVLGCKLPDIDVQASLSKVVL